MDGKDKPCECGHNRWKTIKKRKSWQCRRCGMVRILGKLADNPKRKLGKLFGLDA